MSARPKCPVCNITTLVNGRKVCAKCNEYYCHEHDHYFKCFPGEIEKRKSSTVDYMEIDEDFDKCPICDMEQLPVEPVQPVQQTTFKYAL